MIKIMKTDFSLVPKNNKILNEMHNYLCRIRDVEVCSVKGMLFVDTKTENSKRFVKSYLEGNNNLFEYAR